MGFSQTLSDCGNTLNGLGDNTAGPIWKFANVDNAPPVGGFSDVTNYPNGESLGSPIDAVVVGQSLLLWTTSKIAGPICGYNLANILGYMSASLVMFGFIYSITKGRRWIALLAGYAVAFTPYFQVKIGVHPSYGFQALLIGVLWASLSFMTTYKKSRAILLAVLLAACFYFDPYFSLLAITIVAPMMSIWFILGLIKLRKSKFQKSIFIPKLKSMALFVGAFILLVLPLAFIITTQSSQINSAVVGTRDNIIDAGKTYSNVPSEYLLPFPDSSIFKLLGDYGKKLHDSMYIFSSGGLSEDVVGISLAMVVIVGLFFIILFWERIRGKKLDISKLLKGDSKLIVCGTLFVAIAAMIMALPPIHIFGIPLPSYLLLSHVNVWRVISREYVVVNIAVTVLFAIALAYFGDALKLKKLAKTISYIVIFLFILMQYQTYGPFQGIEPGRFSYSNASQGYYWLKDQADIKTIAEYPIEKVTEANSPVYYLSMQLVHKKKLLNNVVSNSQDDILRSSIRNLSDPQTVPALHSIGIDAVVIHGVEPADIEKIPYLKVVYQGPHGKGAMMPDSPAITKDIIVIAKITDDTPVITDSLQFTNNLPANGLIQKSAIDWQYEIPTNSTISLKSLFKSDASTGDAGEVCFMYRMASIGDISDLIISDNSGGIARLPINDQYKKIKFTTKVDNILNITSSNGHNMRFSGIGCN